MMLYLDNIYIGLDIDVYTLYINLKINTYKI